MWTRQLIYVFAQLRMIVEGEIRARNLLKEKEVELHRVCDHESNMIVPFFFN